MAFHQPTRQAVQRPPREESQDRDDVRVSTVLPAALERSQTWVLFSPNADTATTSSILDSLPESSQQTAGRSRLSDLGSLRSLVPSNYASSYAPSAFARPANLHLSLLTSAPARSQANDEAVMSDDGRPDAEDDAELDSLDSHLPDFRPTTQNQAQGQQLPPHMTATATTTVNLPTHDGLGSFRLGNAAGMSAAVQEHLYSFEQFNPRRVTKRRRESLDLAQLQADDEFTEDVERTRRIELWRWDHSRVLLEEIQKETRRRRGSELSARRSRAGSAVNAALTPGAIAGDGTSQAEASADWHDQEEDDRLLKLRKAAGEDGGEPNEGLWSRITRKFMLEVMGIDDRILSVLFGEDLTTGEEQDDEMDLSSTPRASNPLLEAAAAGIDSADMGAHDDDSSSWQLRMLERIAKELGLFVHSHVSSHPGAFSTFTRVQQMPLPYAGLPVIPEAMIPATRVLGSEHEAGEAFGVKTTDDVTPTGTTASLPRFKPTIYQARPMDIPGQATENTAAAVATAGPAGNAAANSTSSTPTPAQAFTQDEWEQDLDIKLVFRYLRSRFFSGSGSASNHAHRHHLHHHAHHHGHGSGGSSSSMTMNSQEAAAKVARVRQHHPLVGRGTSAARQTGERRPMPAFRNMNATGGVNTPSSPILGMRHGHAHGTATSCASQSTRRSARRSSISSRHSSRHYWDIGGSIGTGSMIASAGPMGSWGEV